jgi:branched-chain amino acid transport system ATP-binding protein
LKPLLEVEDLTVAYGGVQSAVRGVSLRIADREVAVVLGANGAGKTSLLRGIGGFWRGEAGRVVAGRVSLAGRNMTRSTPAAMASAGVAIVPQDRKVFASMSVVDNLRAVPRRGSHREHERQFSDILALFPRLSERLSLPAGFLSGGERQLLGVARALLLRPRVLLLDEPSMGLSPVAIHDVFTQLYDAAGQLGAAVLLVEQNARAALPLADSVHVMQVGRFLFSGSPGALESDEAIRHAYLGTEGGLT